MTQELGPSDQWSIDEDQLHAAKPKVRALHVQRYEQLWSIVNDKIRESDDQDRPLDPRYLELGIKILKEESLLYRLNKVEAASVEEEDDPAAGIDRAAEVLAQLEILEARRQERSNGAGP
jgi:hypothetical protein